MDGDGCGIELTQYCKAKKSNEKVNINITSNVNGDRGA